MTINRSYLTHLRLSDFRNTRVRLPVAASARLHPDLKITNKIVAGATTRLSRHASIHLVEDDSSVVLTRAACNIRVFVK